jgi:hypothetical protein
MENIKFLCLNIYLDYFSYFISKFRALNIFIFYNKKNFEKLIFKNFLFFKLIINYENKYNDKNSMYICIKASIEKKKNRLITAYNILIKYIFSHL